MSGLRVEGVGFTDPDVSAACSSPDSAAAVRDSTPFVPLSLP